MGAGERMWRVLLTCTGVALASGAFVARAARVHVRRRVHGAVARGVGVGVGVLVGVLLARRGLAAPRRGKKLG